MQSFLTSFSSRKCRQSEMNCGVLQTFSGALQYRDCISRPPLGRRQVISKLYFNWRLPSFFFQEDLSRKTMQTIAGGHVPRYSGTNLSSPESAYSTGYSTDGTSPGAPPEYYINIRTGRSVRVGAANSLVSGHVGTLVASIKKVKTRRGAETGKLRENLRPIDWTLTDAVGIKRGSARRAGRFTCHA